MTAPQRQARADAADAACAAAFAGAVAGARDTGLALVAVGGYGRGDLAPHSDLDLVLVHAESVPEHRLAAIAQRLWYPLWEAGPPIDHAVRSLPQVTGAARGDVRVTLGLLDARHLAGDPAVTLQLRTAVAADWRRHARQRLPRLRELVSRRADRAGELAHAAVPDVKESLGGLRDTTVLTALVASWLVDVPHSELRWCRRQLLDLRDVLHEVAGRRTDRIAPELWDDLAARLGRSGPVAAQRQVRELGRRVTHLSRLTWRRVDAVLDRPGPRLGPRRPALVPLGHGLATASGEVVLDGRVAPERDPSLLVRAAAEAAERDLILAPATAARLARDCPAPGEPWPDQPRDLLVRLLSAGAGLLPVWETLEETGAVDRLLPEWSRVRLLPHASPVHRFTVDRHLVETCIEASRLVHRVGRPDLLVLAALLHDLGKAGPGDHSVAGAPVAAAAARRLGFGEADRALIAALVRHHLLLVGVATTRDLADPATARDVARRLRSPGMLELLAALTEADARATAPAAWTSWRAGLVAELTRRVHAELAGRETGSGRREPVAGRPVSCGD